MRHLDEDKLKKFKLKPLEPVCKDVKTYLKAEISEKIIEREVKFKETNCMFSSLRVHKS